MVDDDRASLTGLAELVEMEGFDVATAGDLAAARASMERHHPDLVLTDLMLPDGHGTELLRELAEEPDVEVILVTGQASVETAVEALRFEALDYLTKPVDMGRLKALLASFHRTRELKREVASLRAQLRDLGRFGEMVGEAEAMQKVYALIEKVAPTDASVLISGESGTGKELAARTLHRLSRRRGGPFLAVNCGAIAENLIESELFGHEKGAFTGADRRHEGLFERATGGTLFLDEITEMPLELQVKLLRVLETGHVRRVGGAKEIETDVRILAATNREPSIAVEEKNLREDLYYRLRVFPIELPPLRRRPGDVRRLAFHFLDRLNRNETSDDVPTKRFSEDSLRKLEYHTWPGNVRELQNVVHRAYILGDEILDPEHIPLDGPGEARRSGPKLEVRVGSSIADVEKRLILATLDELGSEKKRTAEVLGISLKTLYNRLKAYEEEDGEVPGET